MDQHQTEAFKRYGTNLRIYDNGGKTFDRFTILPPRHARQYREGKPGTWSGIGSSLDPYHPQGFGMWITASPGHWLGVRVRISDVSESVVRFIRASFPEFV